MNTKITFVELVDLMAEATSTTKRVCELFLRELFATISHQLIDGDSVKIKGVGTFKTVSVKPRKSVNISTGEAIEITSYKKITFTPDKSLAEAVNQPFAQFETVMLDDAVTDEKLAEIDKQFPSQYSEPDELPEPPEMPEPPAPSPDDIPARVTTVVDIKSAAAPQTLSEKASSESNEGEVTPAPEKAPETTVPELQKKELDNAPEDTEIANPDPEPVKEPVAKSVVAPIMGIPIDGPSTPQPEEEKKPEPEPEPDDNFYRPEPKNAYTPTEEQISSHRKPNRTRLWILCGVLAVGLLTWLLVKNCQGDSQPETNQQKVVVADSTAVETVDTVKAAKAVESAEPEVITDTVTAQIVLSTLSEKYYDSPWFWVYIYEENKGIISDPNNVRPGTEVVIPPAEKYGIDAKDKASLKKAQRLSWEILKGK